LKTYLQPDDIQIEQGFISAALVESFIQRPSAIACFFLVCAETVIMKERKGGSLSSNISYMILKYRDNTNQEGNSITNAHMTRGP
jgi:hypothetical protein